jgi:hypothetical protein
VGVKKTGASDSPSSFCGWTTPYKESSIQLLANWGSISVSFRRFPGRPPPTLSDRVKKVPTSALALLCYIGISNISSRPRRDPLPDINPLLVINSIKYQARSVLMSVSNSHSFHQMKDKKLKMLLFPTNVYAQPGP